ncbi:MAG: carboxypeptidase regulatory-like domain-containing protein [Elusimicrobiota bacterium]
MKRVVCLLLSCILIFSFTLNARAVLTEGRCLWITRWDYKNAADIQALITQAKNANFNIVLFQVRGTADAFYNSKYEPWSDDLGTLGVDPGWDPLAEAVTRAHAAGLELHAWINTFPAWSGTSAPPSCTPTHIYNAHPDWICVDSNGTKQALNSSYVSVSPGIPAVQDHLYNVVVDIITSYNVDGIHFDYIRYPNPQYSHDTISTQRFNDHTVGGGNPNNLAWAEWQREQITGFVERVYNGIAGPNGIKPGKKISASVWGIYKDIWGWGSSEGYSDYYQDSRKWLAKGIIDFECPMIYWPIVNTSGGGWNFKTLVEDFGANSYGRHIYSGLIADYASFSEVNNEIVLARNTAGISGSAIFAHSTLKSRAYYDDLVATGGPYNEIAIVPPMPWKITADTGSIQGVITKTGGSTPVSGASVQIWLGTVLKGNKLTDANGAYSLVLGTGAYTVTVTADGFSSVQENNVLISSFQNIVRNYSIQAIMGTIAGQVTETGTLKPIYNVNIEFLQNNIVSTKIQPNENGYYSLNLTSGTYTFRVEGPGYDVVTLDAQTIVPDTTMTRNYTLTPSTGFYANGFWHEVFSGNTYYHSAVSTAPTFWYGKDDTGDYDNALQNAGDLITPFYGIVTAQSRLTFWSYEQTDGRTGADKRQVFVSPDYGTTWNKVYDSAGTQSAWYKVDLDLSAYANSKILIKFRFDTVDPNYNSYLGWYINDVNISNLGGYITGIVYQPGGVTPLNGAKIRVMSDTNTEITSTLTGENGLYSILAPRGTWTLRASYPPYDPQTQSNVMVIPSSTTANINFTMQLTTDFTAPGTVVISTAAPAENAVGGITLDWTATGDDGSTGDLYDALMEIRSSTNAADGGSTALNSTIWPLEILAGTTQTHTVTGLLPGATYFLWLRIADNARNWSAFSTVASAYSNFDGVSPSAVTNLTASTREQILLTWTAPGDNGIKGDLINSKFEITYTTKSANISASSDNYVLFIPTTTKPGVNQILNLTALVPFATYYIWLRTYDDAENPSAYSSKVSAYAWVYSKANTAIPASDSTYAIAIADYDNDGSMDIAIANYQDPVFVYRNTNGAFVLDCQTTQTSSSYGLYSLSAGDYNNDGYPDLLSANEDETKRVYRNSGNHSFTQSWASTDSDPVRCSAWADFNNDGKLDFIVGNYRDSLKMYLNSGNNVFTLTWSSTETLRSYRFACNDFDNDGYIDFAVVSSRTPYLAVYKNTGNNKFTLSWQANPAANYGGLDIADLDNDGDMDIIGGFYNSSTRAYRNNGAMSFTQMWSSGLTDVVSSLSCGDFNNDGLADIVLANNTAKDRIYVNLGNDSFYAFTDLSAKNSYEIETADFNNDNTLDCFTTQNNKAKVLISNLYTIKNNTVPVPPSSSFKGVYSNGAISLTWGTGSDVETPQAALIYNVRIGTFPGGCNLLSSVRNGKRLIPQGQNTVNTLTFSVLQNTTYYWAVQTIDTVKIASPWSVEQAIYPPVVSRGRISGKVVSTSHSIADALVEALENSTVINSVNTDSNGNYEIDLPTNTYILRASKIGYQTKTSTPIAVETGIMITGYNFLLPVTTNDIILDDAETTKVTAIGDWSNSTTANGYYGSGYKYTTNTPAGQTFEWRTAIPVDGSYTVYAMWTSAGTRSTDAKYTVTHATGTTMFMVNQTLNNGEWMPLGTFSFTTGITARVSLSNNFSSGTYVIADAVKFVATEITITSATISGKVTETDNTTAVTGASVTITGSQYAYNLVTANDGSFIYALTPGSYTITAGKEGYTTDTQYTVTLTTGLFIDNINFKLSVDTSTTVTISTASLTYAVNTGTVAITFSGSGFNTVPVLTLTNGNNVITPLSITRTNVSSFTCIIDLAGVTAAKYKIAVTMPDGRIASIIDDNFMVLLDHTKHNTVVSGYDSKLRLYIPSGTLSTDAYFTFNILSLTAPEYANVTDIAEANTYARKTLSLNLIKNGLVEINGYNRYSQRLTSNDYLLSMLLSIPYDDNNNDNATDTGNINVNTLNIYTLNSTRWETGLSLPLINTTYKIVTLSIPHCSVFALLGRAIPTTLASVRVYPNPTTGTQAIAFSRITKDAVIKLYNINGELVRELFNYDYDDIETWDLTNSAGEPVATGVYVYLITDPLSNKVAGKLAVIK